MITREQIEKLRNDRDREKLLEEMHWWKQPPENWAFAKHIVDADVWKENDVRSYERTGFIYEASARIPFEKEKKIEWDAGKPFAQLGFSVVRTVDQYFSNRAFVIGDIKEDREGIWSEPFRINLEATKKEILKAVWGRVQREREFRYSDGESRLEKRKHIAWEGIEAWDRKLFFPHKTPSAGESKAITRLKADFSNRRF